MGQGRTTGAWSYPQLWHMVILMAFALTRLSPLFTAKTHLSDLLAMTDCLLHHYSYLTHSLFLLRRATAHEDCGTKYPWVGSEGLIKWHHEVTSKELPPWWTGINSAVCLLRWDLCAYPCAGHHQWKWGSSLCPSSSPHTSQLFLEELPCSWGASFMAQMGKNLHAKQEMRVQSLGQEDPLEKGLATHSSILVWRIPGTEEPGRLQPMGS